MAYQTGTVTSISDLKTTIETFCTTNGWTKTGTVLHKGNSYVQLTVNTDNLEILGGTGQSGGSLTGAATNPARLNGYLATITYPASYFLFAHATPDTVVCVLNHDAVYYPWLAFGEVTKHGVFTGGNWFGAIAASAGIKDNRKFTVIDGYSWVTGVPQTLHQPSIAPWWKTYDNDITKTAGNCQIYCNLDSNTWVSNSDHEDGAVYSAPGLSPLVQHSRSLWNEQAVLIPPILLMKRPSGFRSAIGMPGHFRFCRVDNYSPGDIVTIGVDKWMLFPFYKKDLDDTPPYSDNSGPYGWAISYDGP